MSISLKITQPIKILAQWFYRTVMTSIKIIDITHLNKIFTKFFSMSFSISPEDRLGKCYYPHFIHKEVEP